jgi:hypothetical protein
MLTRVAKWIADIAAAGNAWRASHHRLDVRWTGNDIQVEEFHGTAARPGCSSENPALTAGLGRGRRPPGAARRPAPALPAPLDPVELPPATQSQPALSGSVSRLTIGTHLSLTFRRARRSNDARRSDGFGDASWRRPMHPNGGWRHRQRTESAACSGTGVDCCIPRPDRRSARGCDAVVGVADACDGR